MQAKLIALALGAIHSYLKNHPGLVDEVLAELTKRIPGTVDDALVALARKFLGL
jgi:hypothetical protein